MILFEQHNNFTLFSSLFSWFTTKKEIDGKALTLLDTDKMTHYMELKLGPALKIAELVKRAVNARKHTNN